MAPSSTSFPPFSDFELPLHLDSSLSLLSSEHGSPPFSSRLVMLLAKAGNDRSRRKDGSINRRLSDLLELKSSPNKLPSRGVFSRDIVLDPSTSVWSRFFFPSASSHKLRPVIFYFHGGGFCFLTADTISYDTFCRRLCRRTGAVVISVNYRRSPEHRCPVPYQDCFAAIKWVWGLSSSKERREMMMPYELDLGRCVLMGDSAGANIVHHVGCMIAKELAIAPARAENGGGHSNGDSGFRVAAHVLLFPFFGGEELTASEMRLANGPLVCPENVKWCWRAFLPQGETRDHWACNVLAGEAGKEVAELKLPESLVVVAEFDGLKDWQYRYAKGLSEMGKEVRLLYYRKGVHAFHVLDRFKHSALLLSHLTTYLQTVQATAD